MTEHPLSHPPPPNPSKILGEVAELAFSAGWHHLPLILTCGPTEQLRVLKNEASRHPEVQVVEIPVEAMSLDEQVSDLGCFLTAIMIKLTRVRVRYFLERGLGFVLDRLDVRSDSNLLSRIAEANCATSNGPNCPARTPRLLSELRRSEPAFFESEVARQGVPPFRRRCAALTRGMRSRLAGAYRSVGSVSLLPLRSVTLRCRSPGASPM